MIEAIGDVDNLYYAYKRASKKKRHKPTVFKFERSLMVELYKLSLSIKNGTYKVTEPKMFEIVCVGSGKIRNISAPSFADATVQHAIYSEVYPIFDKGFIHDNYGCRLGKGTHKAADRCQEFMRKHDGDLYYLQMDIKKFYYSIDHAILRTSLLRKLEEPVVDLLMQYVVQNADVGLNVGNLVSQLFGIIYLDRFDHFVKRDLKCKHYIRYVDDMVIMGLTREEAYLIKEICEVYLKKELNLEFSKWKIAKIKTGINFVGFRTWRSKRFVRKRSLKTISKSIKNKDVRAMQSVLAHAKHTSSYKYLLTQVIKRSPFNILPRFGGKLRHDIFLLYYSHHWTHWYKNPPKPPRRI